MEPSCRKRRFFISPLPPFSLSQALLGIANTSPAGDEGRVVQRLFVKGISAPTTATLNFRKAITHASEAATTLATCRIPQGAKAAVLRLCGKKPRSATAECARLTSTRPGSGLSFFKANGLRHLVRSNMCGSQGTPALRCATSASLGILFPSSSPVLHVRMGLSCRCEA